MPGDDIGGGGGHEKNAGSKDVMAPSATVVCWGQEDRIFAVTEKIDAQLDRVSVSCRRRKKPPINRCKGGLEAV